MVFLDGIAKFTMRTDSRGFISFIDSRAKFGFGIFTESRDGAVVPSLIESLEFIIFNSLAVTWILLASILTDSREPAWSLLISGEIFPESCVMSFFEESSLTGAIFTDSREFVFCACAMSALMGIMFPFVSRFRLAKRFRPVLTDSRFCSGFMRRRDSLGLIPRIRPCIPKLCSTACAFACAREQKPRFWPGGRGGPMYGRLQPANAQNWLVADRGRVSIWEPDDVAGAE